jgi:hypothetical protein
LKRDIPTEEELPFEKLVMEELDNLAVPQRHIIPETDIDF